MAAYQSRKPTDEMNDAPHMRRDDRIVANLFHNVKG